ncbi:MAG: hypothetical protein SWH68_08460 [Thermodesulfobacteriota bacterium]|nr:hypothetical protein [Thermodesulfobacteriota bacterium]
MIPVQLTSEKKSIYAWHDINLIYVITALFSGAVFLFSMLGIQTAMSIPAYTGYAWVPALLLVLSGGILASSLFRLARRWYLIMQDRYDW